MQQSNDDTFIDSVIYAIDNKNFEGIENLSKNFNYNNENSKNNNNDIIYELYNYDLLTVERLEFIMKKCKKYLNISSIFLKKIIERRENWLT